jgi:hypothetical protein
MRTHVCAVDALSLSSHSPAAGFCLQQNAACCSFVPLPPARLPTQQPPTHPCILYLNTHWLGVRLDALSLSTNMHTHLLHYFVLSKAQPVAHSCRLLPLRLQLRSHCSSSIHQPSRTRAARPLLRMVLWAVARAVAVAPPEAACGPYRPWGPVLPVLLLL